jgi:hypothetical protein
VASGRHTRGRAINIALALVDDDYYAEVRARLKGDARRAFEAAVDKAWREKHAQSASA